jgi:thermostable 8-oxoguanine DNA glycosylase
MINPNEITNYNRTQDELEEFLLFCVMVAGKGAKQTAMKLDEFLSHRDGKSPLGFVEDLINEGSLDYMMRLFKLGQYGRLASAFAGIVKFKDRLKEVSANELESVSGIGPKTARFFLLHSRENIQHAVLDTHILKWLRSHGENAPKSTPSGEKYLQLEQRFLNLAKDYQMSIADLDLAVWKQYSSKEIELV